MTFKVVGEQRVMNVLINAPHRFKEGIIVAGNKAGKMLVNTTKEGILKGGKSGHTYNGIRASAPGEYPANRTGGLLNSIDHTMNGAHSLEFGTRGAFNRDFDYAKGVHEGTSKMASRPYLTKAFREKEGAVRRVLGETTWRKIIGG